MPQYLPCFPSLKRLGKEKLRMFCEKSPPPVFSKIHPRPPRKKSREERIFQKHESKTAKIDQKNHPVLVFFQNYVIRRGCFWLHFDKTRDFFLENMMRIREVEICFEKWRSRCYCSLSFFEKKWWKHTAFIAIYQCYIDFCSLIWRNKRLWEQCKKKHENLTTVIPTSFLVFSLSKSPCSG